MHTKLSNPSVPGALRWATWLLATVLLSCGGGGDPAPQPPSGITRLTSEEDVLHLPLLRSGDRWYSHVKLALSDDGSFAGL